MAPFLAAAIPALLEAVPAVARLFSSGSPVAERNVKAAEALVGVAKEAVGAVNEQDLIERLKDPANAEAVRAAVEANWFELEQAAEKSRAAARDFNVKVAEAKIRPWDMPAFWVSCGLLLPLYAVVGSVLWLPAFDKDLKLQVITATLAVIGLVGAFWLGSSSDSQRKTQLLAGRDNGSL